jgi:hypothetical protein
MLGFRQSMHFFALDFFRSLICIVKPLNASPTHLNYKLYVTMASMDTDPMSAHLSRVASLLAENVLPTAQKLAELRTAVSAIISTYSTVHVKHGYLEAMLEAAANVWVGVNAI